MLGYKIARNKTDFEMSMYLGSPLNNGDIFWFNKYVYLFLCNEDYSVANCMRVTVLIARGQRVTRHVYIIYMYITKVGK